MYNSEHLAKTCEIWISSPIYLFKNWPSQFLSHWKSAQLVFYSLGPKKNPGLGSGPGNANFSNFLLDFFYPKDTFRAGLLCETAKKVTNKILVCKKGDLWRTWMINSQLIVFESMWFPWSSRINFIPSRILRGPLFHKPVIGQELFCCFLQQTGSNLPKNL